jgi:hypothetical protein
MVMLDEHASHCISLVVFEVVTMRGGRVAVDIGVTLSG